MIFYYIRLAVKSLKQTPVVSLLMLLAIAVGIGVSMTTLVLHQMRTSNPIPQKSDQLHVIQLQSQNQGNDFHIADALHAQISYRDAINVIQSDIPERSTALFRAGLKIETHHLDQQKFSSPAKKHGVLFTTHDFFSMFNVPIIYGQAWDKITDDNALPQVVIGKGLNTELFAGENSVGKKILIENNVFEIVAVLDRWNPVPRYYDITVGAFHFSDQLFIPLSHAQTNTLKPWNNIWGNVNGWKNEQITTYEQFIQSELLWMHAWAELLNQQQKEDFSSYLEAYIKQQQNNGRFPRADAGYDLKDLMHWLDYRNIVSQDSYILLVLSFLFLTVCLVNALGLMLSKFLGRAPHIGVIRALGVNRSQVFIQHLVEVGVLGLIGGLFGLLLAQLILTHIRQYSGEFQLLAHLNWQMMATAPLLAILVTVLAGLFPAWCICTTQPSRYLKSQ